MQTAKIIANGGSQAVRLPKECRLSGDEVYVRKFGNVVMLVPKDGAFETFLESLNDFTDDFADIVTKEHSAEHPSARETL